MIADFAQKISAALPKNTTLHHLMLRETETSFAEWYASDQ
jgi:6-pyruvoyltetrahydropterin/6-carboxytetrahydropterin synthase